MLLFPLNARRGMPSPPLPYPMHASPPPSHLPQVLFEHIDGEDGADGDEGGADAEAATDDGAEDMSVGGGSDDASARLLLRSTGGAVRLAAFKRRAALSGWLAAKASRGVLEAVTAASRAGGREVLLWALLHLVAGHQLGQAAALAAAAGDVRLAVLLSTAGRHAAISADVARQLQVGRCKGVLCLGCAGFEIALVPEVFPPGVPQRGVVQRCNGPLAFRGCRAGGAAAAYCQAARGHHCLNFQAAAGGGLGSR